MTGTTDEAGEVEIQVGKCAKTPSVYVPGEAKPESAPEHVVKPEDPPTDLPECAPPAQTSNAGDGKGNTNEDIEEKKNASFVEKAARSPDMAMSGMKTLTGKINKINRQQRKLQRTWRSLKRAFGTLGKNANGILGIFGGGE